MTAQWRQDVGRSFGVVAVAPLRPAIAAVLVVVGAVLANPAIAKVVAEGKPSGGYYWQKVEQSNGTRYLCRSTSDAKIQKHAKCESARAVKP